MPASRGVRAGSRSAGASSRGGRLPGAIATARALAGRRFDQGGQAVEDAGEAELAGVVGVVGAALGLAGGGADAGGDGFVSLGHPDAGMNVVLPRRGLEVLPAGLRDQRADGLIPAFTVDDAAGTEARLRGAGVETTLPLLDEPWGERLFQVTDPNGVTVQFTEWRATAAA